MANNVLAHARSAKIWAQRNFENLRMKSNFVEGMRIFTIVTERAGAVDLNLTRWLQKQINGFTNKRMVLNLSIHEERIPPFLGKMVHVEAINSALWP